MVRMVKGIAIKKRASLMPPRKQQAVYNTRFYYNGSLGVGTAIRDPVVVKKVNENFPELDRSWKMDDIDDYDDLIGKLWQPIRKRNHGT